MTPIVRKAREKEYPAISRILNRAGWDGFTNGAEMHILTIENPNPEGKRWIVGCVGVVEENRICMLAVEKNHQGKGYGTLLVRRMVELLNLPYLRVRFGNWKAIRLYIREGFFVTGIYLKRSFEMYHFRKWIKSKYTLIHLPALPKLNTKRVRKFFKSLFTRKKKLPFVISKRYIGTISPKITDDAIKSLHYYLDFESREILKKHAEEFRTWKDEKGTTWTKRFESLLYKNGIKIDKYKLENIGNALRTYVETPYNIDFHDKVDWNKGDFGDIASCFLTYNRPIIQKMFDCGRGFAIRVYDPERPEKGIGRCWLYVDDEVIIPFNSRGWDRNQFLELLTTMLDLEYTEVNIFCNYDQMYFDSSQVYLLGKNLDYRNYTMNWNKEDD